MALGNTASLTLAVLNSQLGAHAALQRSYYDTIKRLYAEYQAILANATLMATFALSAGDLNQLNVFVGDLGRQISLFEGQVPTTSNIVNDLAVISGAS